MKTSSGDIYLLAKKHVIKRRQFILYAIIGLSGVIVDYATYSFGVKVLGLGILLANFISISLGIINNFIFNTRYNFKVKDRLFVRFWLFYAVGFLGLVFSELLLVGFHNGFHMGALSAKLLTLPFVLVGQYALNRFISFGSIEESQRMIKRLFFHWPSYMVVLLFGACSLFLVKNIPDDFSSLSVARAPAYAPDESSHYAYNVAYILDHKRLPVSGRDDLSAYKSCSPNHLAEVHCGYSYEVYPGTSYVVSAISASILSHSLHVPPVMGARVPSTIYGVIFVVCAYFTAYIITRRRLIATLLAAGVGLIPEYIFTSSYTNLDAHSIAISGLVGLAFVNYLVNPSKKWALPLLGITTAGLLPLAKYNFFILAVPVFVTVLYLGFKKRISGRELWRLIGWSALSFLLLSSFWYIRDIVLYHDLLGQNFALNQMAHFYPQGQAMPFATHTFVIFNALDFFGILYRSFYYAFGGMFYYLGSAVYLIPASLTVLGFVFLVYRLAEENKRLRLVIYAFIAYLLMVGLTIAQVVYNSMVYDFQPQGRYLYPILIPTVIFLGYCAKKDKELEKLTLLLVAGTIFVLISSIGLTIKLYYNV